MSSDVFEVVPKPGGSQLTLLLRGEFDIATRPVFFKALTNALVGPAKVLVVDLSELTFIDAFGLEALVLARDGMRVRGRQVIIENPSPWLTKVIGVSGLGDLLQTPEEPSSAPTDRRPLINDNPIHSEPSEPIVSPSPRTEH